MPPDFPGTVTHHPKTRESAVVAKAKKTSSKEPDYSSPKWTFVALFADGVVTRMTTFCADGEFDLERGIALARAAYDSKTGNDRLELAVADRKRPPISAAKFIEPGYNDTVLKEYDSKELLEASN
jgi:hypothetical protein